MTTDRYTKTVLTVIAIALSVIALRMGFINNASAECGLTVPCNPPSLALAPADSAGESCGSISNPCYIVSKDGLEVRSGLGGLVVTGPSFSGGEVSVRVTNWQ